MAFFFSIGRLECRWCHYHQLWCCQREGTDVCKIRKKVSRWLFAPTMPMPSGTESIRTRCANEKNGFLLEGSQ